MAIEPQVIPVVIGASEVIDKTTFLTVLAVTCEQPPSTPNRKTRWGKRSVILTSFLIIFPRIETSHIYSIFLFSFLADGDLLPGEVAFSRLD